MKNNYLIISDDKISIEEYIKGIIKKINKKDAEIIKYDYPDTSINTVLEDLNTYNFLSNTKIIIYYNCSFLSKETDKEIKGLKKYFDNPSDNYLIVVNDSLSEKKEIKELISNNVEIIDGKLSSSLLIKNNLEDFKMDDRTIKYLEDYCLQNNEKILNELEKIKCYKLNDTDKNITIDEINKIAIKDYDEDIFDLVNTIAVKNKEKAFAIYYRVLQKEKDSINIIASVAGSIRNLYSVKVLQENKMSRDEISNILGIKPYAVSKALENCNNYSSKKLLALLDNLAEIDFKSKSESEKNNSLFENFLLNL